MTIIIVCLQLDCVRLSLKKKALRVIYHLMAPTKEAPKDLPIIKKETIVRKLPSEKSQ
jgi:hypothetical protein